MGEKLVNKIIQTYGSYDNFIESMNNYDIDKLMNISGLSQKKALEIVKYVQGNDTSNFLKTSQAQNIYEDILKEFLTFPILHIHEIGYYFLVLQPIMIR